MPRTIHVNAKLTPRQRKELHGEKGLTLKQLCEKYRISVPTIYKWKRRIDFDDRSHAPISPPVVLSPFEQHLICEVRKSTGFSVEDLIHVLKPHVPRIGRGNAYLVLAREKLSRKEYLTPQQTKSKFKSKKFKSHSPGYLHIDIKHVPKVDKTRNYLFVAVDRNTRLVTIGIYPKSGTEEAVAFLRHCVDFFEFPLSHVLTDNAACFTDRVRQSRRGPSGKHLFDKACKQHAIEHKLTSVFLPQTATVVQRLNPRVSQLFKSVHFENHQTLTETIQGPVNHYNHSQTQPALGGLTPSGYWNQAKDKGAKLKVRSPDARAEPADPKSARVKPGNAAPDPTISKRKASQVQEHPAATCHPQLNQDDVNNHTYSYSYPSVTPISFPRIHEEIMDAWDTHKVFEESLKPPKKGDPFVFYEGPPSANGSPGIHHMLSRTVKDIFCRYHSQSGRLVLRKGGWDAHGLPVELAVEKELGITKADIGKKISVGQFNEMCRASVMRFKAQWELLSRRMGYWLDLKEPYITCTNAYIESVWHVLKDFHQKGLLYKGYSVQPYSPAAGSGLSSHELNQPGAYRDVIDTSVVVQLRVRREEPSEFLFDHPKEQVFLLAWTTTPWTLPSNVALGVNPDLRYVKVEARNPYSDKLVSVVVQEDLVSFACGDDFVMPEHAMTFPGSQLVGARYHQLMTNASDPQVERKAFRVLEADFVNPLEGTGIVHLAPHHGADDQRICKLNGVPSLSVRREGGTYPLVDREGKFESEVTDFAGMYVRTEYYEQKIWKDPSFRSTDQRIVDQLKKNDQAFRVLPHRHSYPHCWRTDKPILYYPMDCWFVRTTSMKQQLIDLNQTIDWHPPSVGSGRFGHWLENLVDWNVSRSRFWGTPLPIWSTGDGKQTKCIGGVDELGREVALSVAAGVMEPLDVDSLDLHKPDIDRIILVSQDGEPMHREEEVVDVWFDSGCMPYAQWHYPFENAKEFEANFPADFIAEGVDQTRGWFFTLHAISTLRGNERAFKNVLSNGLVLDKHGAKMAKRHGNSLDPFKLMDDFGADPIRWYFIHSSNPWDNLKLDVQGIREAQRGFFNTLFNLYQFFATYANIDNYDHGESEVLAPDPALEVLDRWILSRLHRLIAQVRDGYENYDATRCARLIEQFSTRELSNWYLRLNRKRYWGKESTSKTLAYRILYSCLETIARLMAPIAPFCGEKIYQSLHKGIGDEGFKSVHLSGFPKHQREWLDPELESSIRQAQLVCNVVHSLRKKEKIRVRQPLPEIRVPVENSNEASRLRNIRDMVLMETNVRKLTLVSENQELISSDVDVFAMDAESGFYREVKPKFSQVGRKYQKLMPAFKRICETLSQTQIRQLENVGFVKVEDSSGIAEIKGEDVKISFRAGDGRSLGSQEGTTVSLDTTITHPLKLEGIARDAVNKIQNFRKAQGYEVLEKIQILYHSSLKDSLQAMAAHADFVMGETQATSLRPSSSLGSPDPDEGGAASRVVVADHDLTLKILKAS